MQEIRQLYIQKALAEYNRSIERTMSLVIDRRATLTGALKNSISTQISKLQDTGGSSELKFKAYGRFIDMGVGRGHPIGSAAKNQGYITLATGGEKRNTKPIRKPVKFYSKVVYGKLNGLMEDLLYGLSEEMIETLKKELHANPQHN